MSLGVGLCAVAATVLSARLSVLSVVRSSRGKGVGVRAATGTYIGAILSLCAMTTDMWGVGLYAVTLAVPPPPIFASPAVVLFTAILRKHIQLLRL